MVLEEFMKKYYIIIVIIICLLLFLVFCGIYSSNQYVEETVMVNDNIIIESIIDRKNQVLELQIINNDDVTLVFDLEYEVHARKNDKWKKQTVKVGVDDIGIQLEAGEIYIQRINLRDFGAKVGKIYRVKKIISGYVCYSEEFEIE